MTDYLHGDGQRGVHPTCGRRGRAHASGDRLGRHILRGHRARVRQHVHDASDEELRTALAALENAGLVYRRPQTDNERQRDPNGWYGPGQTAAYEVREIPEAEGSLTLRLVVENQVTGAARASRDALHDMRVHLGMEREEVATLLREALRQHMKRELDKVRIVSLRQLEEHDLRFVAAYVYRDFDDVLAGTAWYDVTTGRTWPDEAPAVVKNRLRTEVHRRLTLDVDDAKRAS